MRSPLKEKRGRRTALKTADLAVAYRFSLAAQTRRAIRRCVACGCRVTNRNLGGYDGRSALSADLWCYSCADNAPAIFRAIVRLA